MHWVLESNLHDFGYLCLIATLKRLKIPYTLVKVVPYQNILLNPDFNTFDKEPLIEDGIDIFEDFIFPFGTMGLSRIAVERNWTPGSLFNNEFTFERWSQGFGVNNLLNNHYTILKLSDSIESYPHKHFFIRPCEDNKAFSGMVISKYDFILWQKNIMANHNPLAKLNADTQVVIAPCKTIIQEARMFVFDGKVSTGSYYKFGKKIKYREVLDQDPIIAYANKIVSKYQPAKAFVIDIALTHEGYKIIEINNINSVGLYHANVEKFINSVQTCFSEHNN